MNFESIYGLMDKFDASESVYLELETEGVSIKLKKSNAYPAVSVAAAAPVVSPVPVASAEKEEAPAKGEPMVQEIYADSDLVKAPLVGVFYAASSPDQQPFVQVGSRVEKGDTLCLIEAMKMMSEVVAPKSGVIKEIFVENGAMVEFDASLFAIQE